MLNNVMLCSKMAHVNIKLIMSFDMLILNNVTCFVLNNVIYSDAVYANNVMLCSNMFCVK